MATRAGIRPGAAERGQKHGVLRAVAFPRFGHLGRRGEGLRQVLILHFAIDVVLQGHGHAPRVGLAAGGLFGVGHDRRIVALDETIGSQVVLGGGLGREMRVSVRAARPNRVDRNFGRMGVDRLDRLVAPVTNTPAGSPPSK